MREFTRSLAVGQQETLATHGSYIYYKAGEGDIRIITNSGNDVILKEGHGIRFDRSFTEIDVQNVGDLPLTFRLMIGDGDFQNNRMVGNIEIDGVVDVKQADGEVFDVKQADGEVFDVKPADGEVFDVKPAGGSVAVGAKPVGSFLPVKIYEDIPARPNREKLLINYFNNRPHNDPMLVSVFFIVVKVDGVPFTFFAPFGESGSIEINTTKALRVEIFDNNRNVGVGSLNVNNAYNHNDKISGHGAINTTVDGSDPAYNDSNSYYANNNNYTGWHIMYSIVEVLNDEEPVGSGTSGG